MMPAFSPALDSAIPASASTPLAAAGEGSESSPFAAVIQGLSPDADASVARATGAIVNPATAPVLALATASNAATLPATPVDSASPGSALESVLQALGLSTALMLPDDARGAGSDAPVADPEAGIVASAPDSTAATLTLMPLQPAVAPATSALTAATPGSAASASADLALSSASGSPAQHQARQWLAALAPAQTGSDNLSPNDTLVPAQQAQTAPAIPAAAQPQPALMAAGNGWQQPLTAFFNMTAGGERGTMPSDIAAFSPDGLSLLTNAPQGLVTSAVSGLPTAPGFAQTLSSASPTAPVLASVLPNALQDPTWSDAFGQRVALLAHQGTQTATLQLNPPELGPIQIRIALGEQGARVEFNTARQTTSDLIETAMPRLAAAFEHQGLRLDDTRVNLISNRHDVFSAPSAFSASRQDTPQGDRGQPMPQQPSRASAGSADSPPDAGPGSESARTPLKLNNTAIDYYA